MSLAQTPNPPLLFPRPPRSVIALIPLFDKVVYPFFEKRGKKLTSLQKSGSGLVVAILSMLTAAGLEHWRLALAGQGHLLPPPEGDGDYALRPRSVRLSVFWQAPQYLLVGCSEVLTSISQMEFFYDQSPESMRSCTMALQLLGTALGGFTASALMQLVAYVSARCGREWISPQDLNQGRLDLFFLLLAGLMARAQRDRSATPPSLCLPLADTCARRLAGGAPRAASALIEPRSQRRRRSCPLSQALDFLAFLAVATRFQYIRRARFGVHRSISTAVMARRTSPLAARVPSISAGVCAPFTEPL